MASEALIGALELTIQRTQLRPHEAIALTRIDRASRTALLLFIANLRCITIPPPDPTSNFITFESRLSLYRSLFPLTAIKKAEELFFYPKRHRWEDSRDPNKINYFEVDWKEEGPEEEDEEEDEEEEKEEKEKKEKSTDNRNGGQRKTPFGPRTDLQRKYLDGVATSAKGLFTKTELSRGLARFEEMMAREDPNKFELLHGRSPGLSLDLVESCRSRSWPRFFLEKVPGCDFSYGCLAFLDTYRRCRGDLKLQIKSLFVEVDIDLSRFRILLTPKFTKSAESMEDVSKGTNIYRWQWHDSKTDITYFDVGYSTNPQARIKGHQRRPVNRLVRAMVAIPHFKWNRVKSFILYTQASSAPAALGFASECIFNMLFGSTDTTDVRTKGLNVNLLDGCSGTTALSEDEVIDVIRRAKEFFEKNPSISLPPNRSVATHDPSLMSYTNGITNDSDISASTLFALLTGIIYPRVARKAYSNPLTRLPPSSFPFKIPTALLSRKEQLAMENYNNATEEYGTVKLGSYNGYDPIARAKKTKREREEMEENDPEMLALAEEIKAKKKVKVESDRAEIFAGGEGSRSGQRITGRNGAEKKKMLNFAQGLAETFKREEQ
ncbi:uncharacterized protein JCM6883_004447 [Sporobolomyces salmoneus]|uniref:uncharacterized protein n=1 Tax=Sporobolomyces salmoneus TaxID=183962 RepID=UPI00317B89D2